MALDPVIAGGYRGVEIPNALQQYAQMTGIQNAMQEQRMRALQMRQLEEEGAARNALAQRLQSGQPFTVAEAARFGKPGYDVLTAQRQSAEAESKQQTAAADLAAKYIKQARDQLPMVSDPQTYTAWRAQTLQRLPGLEAFVPPEYSPEIVGRLAMDADKMLEQHFVSQNLGGEQQVLAMPKYGGGPARVVPGSRAAEVPLPPAVVAQRKDIGRASAPTTITNVQAYAPASVEAQKSYISAVSDERKTLRNAPDTIKNIDAAKKLIPSASAFMGKGGEPLLAAASFLNNRLGFGINTQGVTDATVLRTRLFEGILENLKKLDSQPSKEQQRVLSEALGNLGTDPAALNQILDRIAETVEDRVNRYNTDVSDAEQRGVKFPFKPQITLPARKTPPKAEIPSAVAAPSAARTVVRTGTVEGRRVVQYSDGSVDYAD